MNCCGTPGLSPGLAPGAADPSNQMKGSRDVDPRGRGVSRAVNNIAASGTLFLEGELGGLAAGKIGGGPAAGGRTPLAKLKRGVNEDECVALGVEARLEEEGRIEDHAGFVRATGVGDEGMPVGGEERMQARFEPSALHRISKDDLGDRAPVDRPVGGEYRRTPPGHKLVANARPLKEATHARIRIADNTAKVGEHCRDVRFAGTDSADDPDHWADDWIGVLAGAEGDAERAGGEASWVASGWHWIKACR